jgi:hypothetical protein
MFSGRSIAWSLPHGPRGLTDGKNPRGAGVQGSGHGRGDDSRPRGKDVSTATWRTGQGPRPARPLAGSEPLAPRGVVPRGEKHVRAARRPSLPSSNAASGRDKLGPQGVVTCPSATLFVKIRPPRVLVVRNFPGHFACRWHTSREASMQRAPVHPVPPVGRRGRPSCDEPQRHGARRPDFPAPAGTRGIGLCLSGGGFRAALFHLASCAASTSSASSCLKTITPCPAAASWPRPGQPRHMAEMTGGRLGARGMRLLRSFVPETSGRRRSFNGSCPHRPTSTGPRRWPGLRGSPDRPALSLPERPTILRHRHGLWRELPSGGFWATTTPDMLPCRRTTDAGAAVAASMLSARVQPARSGYSSELVGATSRRSCAGRHHQMFATAGV